MNISMQKAERAVRCVSRLLSAPQGGRWLGECVTGKKKVLQPLQKKNKTADIGSKRRPDEHNCIEFTELPVQLTILKSANENQYSGNDRTEWLTLNRSAHTLSVVCDSTCSFFDI